MGTQDALNSFFGSMRRRKVFFLAPVFTASGYGEHSRQVASWLLQKHEAGEIELFINPLNWGVTSWHVDEKKFGGLVGKMQQRCIPPTGQADVSIQLQLPNEWNPTLAPVNIGITAAVETTICSPQWIEACNRMTHVIVPSEHIKRTLESSGKLTTKLSVIPESFPGAFLTDHVETKLTHRLNEIPTSFNFLIFGQLTGDDTGDRKNTYNTVKWLCEEFHKDKEVGIILKTNLGRNTRIDRLNTESVLKQTLSQLKSRCPVYLLHGDIDDSEIPSLYRHPKVKGLVSLTRGEGWGLPLLEAAACGLPVVSTDWSGHLDFMNLGKSIKIAYDLQEIPKSKIDGNVFVPGAKWAEPKQDDFKKKIAKFRDSARIPLEWARELAPTIKKEFSPRAIHNIYDREIGNIVVKK